MPFTAAEMAKHLQGEVIGDGSVVLKGFAPANNAREGDLTFAENEAYLARAEQSAAAAVLVDGHFNSAKKVLIRVGNARIAFAKALTLFFPEPSFPPGIHATAVIAPTAVIDPTAHVGPFCIIGAQSTIGPRCILQGHNWLGERCSLDEDANIFPNVTLYFNTQVGKRVRIHSGTVIGSDGFGYVQDQGVHRKVPQVGTVVIQDDVEIGANVTIDRGTIGPTLIGKGSKIDNLVQVAHNVVMGEGCLLVAQVGIAGSSKLGNFVTVAGQAGIAGHLKVGDHVTIAGQAGVMNDIPEGQKWLGAPARPDRQMKRQMIAFQQLPDQIRRIQELERRVFGPSFSEPRRPEGVLKSPPPAPTTPPTPQ
jgi:UDP-3-O-[3-hydroxymyristoyl] glucosamine N-acyltransferase